MLVRFRGYLKLKCIHKRNAVKYHENICKKICEKENYSDISDYSSYEMLLRKKGYDKYFVLENAIFEVLNVDFIALNYNRKYPHTIIKRKNDNTFFFETTFDDSTQDLYKNLESKIDINEIYKQQLLRMEIEDE